MKKAVIELDLGYEIIYLDGYLVAADYLVTFEEDVMWMYQVYMKDFNGIYVSNEVGLCLGKLKQKEIDEQALIIRVFEFMQNLSFWDFLRNYHDWSMDYHFRFVESVS
ncbi:hypothetical protein AZ66_06970 [Paenibacillus sp. E194]|jgi:hypothetical protein|uniref:Uncharacterized protein n=1 Tax=Paenibacillus alvei TS-15 TaxID=1117108 RepID=S9SSK4_PAEAL|nr:MULTISPECIES: hypothetical protein [Paenibacillus]EPY07103.1 hypothetical protein PAALTS15_11569 [Paenibacillus alvei TS-15]KJB88495.1 hypothetical protein AZ66_06970 [Paenibacillus sp. E194]